MAEDTQGCHGVTPDHSVVVVAEKFPLIGVDCYIARCLCGEDSGEQPTKVRAERFGVTHLREIREAT